MQNPITEQTETRTPLGAKLRRWVPFALTLALAIFGIAACEVEQTQEGELPDVDVDVESGQLPRYDIDGPDVDVGLSETTVTVPKVRIVEEEETISVPYIDVDLPGDDFESERRTVSVELETAGEGAAVEIQEIYAKGDRLWVISRLDESGASGTGRSRVADRVVINVPEDAEVSHYIIGKRPAGSHNEQYRFIASKSAIQDRLSAAKQIYSR